MQVLRDLYVDLSYISFVSFFFFSSRRRHTRCALVTGVQTCALPIYISTSLDGDVATHTANRTATPAATKRFRTNLETVIARYGPDKVSALPTLDPLAPPDIDALIDSYAALGLDSIFLRPINFQGFARKRHDRKSTRLKSRHKCEPRMPTSA